MFSKGPEEAAQKQKADLEGIDAAISAQGPSRSDGSWSVQAIEAASKRLRESGYNVGKGRLGTFLLPSSIRTTIIAEMGKTPANFTHQPAPLGCLIPPVRGTTASCWRQSVRRPEDCSRQSARTRQLLAPPCERAGIGVLVRVNALAGVLSELVMNLVKKSMFESSVGCFGHLDPPKDAQEYIQESLAAHLAQHQELCTIDQRKRKVSIPIPLLRKRLAKHQRGVSQVVSHSTALHSKLVSRAGTAVLPHFTISYELMICAKALVRQLQAEGKRRESVGSLLSDLFFTQTQDPEEVFKGRSVGMPDLSKRIENMAEVRAFLRGRKEEAFLRPRVDCGVAAALSRAQQFTEIKARYHDFFTN